jgi:hypothetical protein
MMFPPCRLLCLSAGSQAFREPFVCRFLVGSPAFSICASEEQIILPSFIDPDAIAATHHAPDASLLFIDRVSLRQPPPSPF